MAKKKKAWWKLFNDDEDDYYSNSGSGNSGSYYSNSGGSYGSYRGYGGYGFNYGYSSSSEDQRKEDTVMPAMSGWQEKDLFKGIDQTYFNMHQNPKGVAHRVNTGGARAEYHKYLKDPSSNIKGMKIEDYMLRDIFKMYYNEEDAVKYEIKPEKMWWNYMLSETDNYMMKIVTRNSFSNSLIMTQAITEKLVRAAHSQPAEMEEMMKQMQNLNEALQQEQDNQKSDDQDDGEGDGQEGEGEQNGEGQGQGSGEGNGGDGKEKGQGDGNGEKDGKDGKEKKGKGKGKGGSQAGKGSEFKTWDVPAIEKTKKEAQPYVNKFKELFKEGIKQAQEDIKKKDDMLSMLGSSDKDVKDLSQLQDYMAIKEQISNIKFNKKDIERFIKKSIKNLKSALAGKATRFTEDLIDADEFYDIPSPECIAVHELLEDAEVFAQKFTMKFDAYVDCSGSMGSGVAVNDGQARNEQLSRMALAKILLYKMCNMNLIGDIYRFEGSVDKKKLGKATIFKLQAGGGTRIDSVIEHVEQTKRPSLIISDGDDTISLHNPMAYVLCLSSPVHFGGKVKGKDKTIGAEYVENKQAVLYKDGEFLPFFVNAQGKAAFREKNGKNEIKVEN